jgi:hypothetical protein
MTTNRLDRVIRNQRRLMFANVAAVIALMSSLGVSLLSLV